MAAIGHHEDRVAVASRAEERLVMSTVPEIRRVPQRDGLIVGLAVGCEAPGRMLSCFAAPHRRGRKMSLGRTLPLLGALLLVAACTTSSRMTPAERLEFYRANAGEPVRSFHSPGRLWGWRAIGDSALTVWTSSNRGFLLELAHRCPDMAIASTIGLTTRTSRVSAGLDSVVIQRSGLQGGRTTCRIDTIRPLNTRVVKESKRDLQDLELVDRDPSVPDEPQ
jgi:hypothetical protein